MSVVKFTVTEWSDYKIYSLGESLKNLGPDIKKEYEKIFRFTGLRKFMLDNRQRFLQRHKILQTSLQNKIATRIEIITEPLPGEITPDSKRPSVTKKIVRLLRKLTGTKNEALQEMILQEIITEEENRLWESKNICLKYLD